MRQQLVDRIPVYTGHGVDCFSAALAVDHEYGINQVVGGQTVFTYQTAGEFVAAVTAHPALRELTEDFHSTAQVIETKAAIF
jgi:hypothetical protein